MIRMSSGRWTVYLHNLIPALPCGAHNGRTTPVLLSLLVCVSVHAQPAQKLFNTGDDYSYSISQTEVRNIFFLDSTHGWLVVADHNSDKLHLFRTLDGGNTWLDTTAPEGFVQVHFLDSSIGWGLQVLPGKTKVPATYRLFRTKSGGRNWKPVSKQLVLETSGRQSHYLVDFTFADPEHGWFVGGRPYNAGLILQTSDGGRTARELKDLSASAQVCWGVLTRDRKVWVYGLGFFLHSEDSGRTWSSLEPEQIQTNKELFWLTSGFLSVDGHGWLTGNTSNAVVLGTKDYGRHWAVQLEIESPHHIDRISSWDRDHACAVAHPNWLFCTIDGGSMWTSRRALPPPKDDQANFFQQLIILKSGKGWALRGGGYLYQTEDGGQTWNETDPMKLTRAAN